MAVPQSDESVDKRRMFDLTGRVALVTGAGRGMGVGMVMGLLRQGAAVVINDVNADLARERAEELAGYGPPVFAVPFDITDLAAVTSSLQRAAELVGAPVDILVNNAGIPASAVSVTQFLDIAPEDWPPYLNLNLYGSMNCIKAAAPGMVERGWGRIIQISSGAGRVGLNHGQALYGAGKSGIEGFIRHIAQEFATQGVTANSVALGLMENVKRNVEIIRPTIERIPMKRLGGMTDVGGMIAFLASEEAGYVTGQTINLNGGVYAN
jgi:3-oxoacyl-[acyl-carrier protein] reductase